MNLEKRSEIFRRLQENIPEPTTELEYTSSFELLIAVILSAQATDMSVNKAMRILYPIANTPEKILKLGEVGLMPYLQSIGLYRNKTKFVIKTCQMLCNEFGGEVPSNREDLERLPGVGRKTANVILNTAFGESTIAVDTHIFRVSNRTKIAPGKNVVEVENKLMKFIPEQYKKNAHHWLILHGRYTCVARKPKCAQCCINDMCEYPQKILS
ncbi:MAG: endonuclease III [Pseudomonadota bacterium]